MIVQIILFITITLVVGAISVRIGGNDERPFARELLSYLGFVVCGIVAFTALVVGLSAVFQA